MTFWKKSLIRELKIVQKMKKGFKKQFSFFPDTWMLPSESLEFKNQVGKFRVYNT